MSFFEFRARARDTVRLLASWRATDNATMYRVECETRVRVSNARQIRDAKIIFSLSPSLSPHSLSCSPSPFPRDSRQFYRLSRARGNCKSPERLRLRARGELTLLDVDGRDGGRGRRIDGRDSGRKLIRFNSVGTNRAARYHSLGDAGEVRLYVPGDYK